jgi:hypothetical protein
MEQVENLKIGQTHCNRFGWRLITIFLCIGILSLVSFPSVAQNFNKQYKKAKAYFSDGNYSAAMDAFKPLTVYDANNSYPEYASFYYALSAQRLGFATVARAQFAQLKKAYPNWQQVDEVNFWLSKIYFEKGDYFVAMQVANEIRDGLLVAKIDTVKKIHLAKIEDIETLKMLQEENQNDIEVQWALARAIAKYDLQGADSILFNDLVVKNSWSLSDFVFPTEAVAKALLKDRYRVVLLFPFKISTLEPSPERKKNQPILDLYQGMKLAVDSLTEMGINIDLFAYDTERDPEVTEQLLAKQELRTADLLIGPLFSEEAKLVQAFSKQHQINLMVNPVSNNSDFLADNPYSFLYQPSHETIGKKSAELISNKVTNKYSIVYYGESPKDSVMAFNFIKHATELGLKVVYAEEVRKETSSQILDRLAKATKYDEYKNPLEFKLKRDSIGSIFVASDDPVIYTKVVNSVETRGDSILIVGGESWIEENSADYTKLERTQVVFASPNFTSSTSGALTAFRSKYLAIHGFLPSENAKKGYEMLMNIGRAMGKFGTYFQSELMRGPVIDGILTPGFKLQPSRDNGMVTFVTFKKGELTEVR